MNNKSLREKAVLAVLGVVALYAFAAVLWFMSQEEAWKRASKAYDKGEVADADFCVRQGDRHDLAPEA